MYDWDGNGCRRQHGLWPFHEYKETFFGSREVICPTGFLIATHFNKALSLAGVRPHLGSLSHLESDLIFCGTCLASVLQPICSLLTQPSHFHGATPFTVARCPPNCITFYRLYSGIPLPAKGCRNLIDHIRGTLLTPDPWLVCADKVAPHTQLRAH